ncbi:MAG: DNA mismatch repair endonuclease MutL [Erysipelotrichaceae bacterium]|jgi:DNA mismatch repair protein MutL|nr:DNA mismatch repair endonuclease MutL [Erysipelotrichaceae bacterium]
MGRIAHLDTQTANMIAAGEVVERPMGVVKELVENAIDAGATRVQITIEEGGLKKITVSDNGCGMDSADAEMCFERHATSKIHGQNELWAIHTLGFRGEALPSIAAVSKVTLSTGDGHESTRVIIGYGRKEKVGPYPCNQGTEISVEGLFYQTPARLKHMRSGAYEASLIQDVISRFALSHPEIAFHFINDERDAFRTSGQGSLLEVLYAVYGKAAAENALPVDFSDYDYHVTGYLIKPMLSRASRNMMHIFLNGRMVRTYKLYQSIQNAYGDFLPKGRYPMCVLSIEMDPHLLDVNVHPSKWEVRISKENQLELLLKEEVYKALCANGQSPEKKKEEAKTAYYQPLAFDTDALTVKKEEAPEPETKEFVLDAAVKEQIAQEAKEDNAALTALQAKIEEKKTSYDAKENNPFPLLEVIGQYKDSYILALADKGLAVIDQKAAQARVEYEKLLKSLHQDPIMIDLTVPVTIHAGSDLIDRLDEINAACADMHLAFELFGRDTLTIRRIPAWLKEINKEQFLQDLLDGFAQEKDLSLPDAQKKRIAMLASRNSVHVHQKLTAEEMKSILLQLSQCPNPWTDPYGHPTVSIIEEQQLLKGLKS